MSGRPLLRPNWGHQLNWLCALLCGQNIIGNEKGAAASTPASSAPAVFAPTLQCLHLHCTYSAGNIYICYLFMYMHLQRYIYSFIYMRAKGCCSICTCKYCTHSVQCLQRTATCVHQTHIQTHKHARTAHTHTHARKHKHIHKYTLANSCKSLSTLVVSSYRPSQNTCFYYRHDAFMQIGTAGSSTGVSELFQPVGVAWSGIRV